MVKKIKKKGNDLTNARFVFVIVIVLLILIVLMFAQGTTTGQYYLPYQQYGAVNAHSCNADNICEANEIVSGGPISSSSLSTMDPLPKINVR